MGDLCDRWSCNTRRTTKQMTEEKKEPINIAGAIIDLSMKLAFDQGMKLVELVGHLEFAKQEVIARSMAAIRQPAEPVSDDGTGNAVAFSPDAGEDKDEK